MNKWIDCRKERDKGEGVETFRCESCEIGGNTTIKKQVKDERANRYRALLPKMTKSIVSEYFSIGKIHNKQGETMRRRTFLSGLTVLSLTVALPVLAAEKELKLGVLAGPHAQIAEQAVRVAAEKGLRVRLIEFSDYVSIDLALNDGDLDANAFQHKPFLDAIKKQRGLKLVAVGRTVVFPLGAYSTKIHNVKDVKDGMVVGIPNDPANADRALHIMQQAGLLKLRDTKGDPASPFDIVENPKHLKIREIEAAALARALPDVDFGFINNSRAFQAGLVPKRDAFLLDDEDSNYANVLAVRQGDENKPEIKTLLASFQSPQVKKFVLEKFKGSIVPAF